MSSGWIERLSRRVEDSNRYALDIPKACKAKNHCPSNFVQDVVYPFSTLAPALGARSVDIYFRSHNGIVALRAEAAPGQMPIDAIYGAASSGAKRSAQEAAENILEGPVREALKMKNAFQFKLVDMESPGGRTIKTGWVRIGQQLQFRVKDHRRYKFRFRLSEYFPVKGLCFIGMQDRDMHERTLSW